jgi:hypothetical protein
MPLVLNSIYNTQLCQRLMVFGSSDRKISLHWTQLDRRMLKEVLRLVIKLADLADMKSSV